MKTIDWKKKWSTLLGIGLALSSAPAAAAGGGVLSTTWNGAVHNENYFGDKSEAYLTATLNDGCYLFQVTDPSGNLLLSRDPARCRVVMVRDEAINDLVPPTEIEATCGVRLPSAPTANTWADGANANSIGATPCHQQGAAGLHNTQVDAGNGGTGVVVQLKPFGSTPNRGNVYKASMEPLASYVKRRGNLNAIPTNLPSAERRSLGCRDFCATADKGFGPPKSNVKNDNFRVCRSVDVSADIVQDTTWTAGTCYTLTDHIFVRDAALTIEPGVQVRGEAASSLVVTSTGRVEADGSAEEPIIFTSAAPAGTRETGDWGGIVLLGNAPINVPGGTDSIEGFPAGTTGTEFGGNDPTHDCGTLRFVRVEFAGFELEANNELNGLTMGGCGNHTLVDYLQVHRGLDDGVEIFGGTVDIKHILVSIADDDGLDWDFGWTGRGQHIVVQQSQGYGNNGFESDNHANFPNNAPRSNPLLYNITLVGSNVGPGEAVDLAHGGQLIRQNGMTLKAGTAGRMFNVIMTHFADFPADVVGLQAKQQAEGGELFIKNGLFFDNANLNTWPVEGNDDVGFDEGAFFVGEATNRLLDPQLTGALNLFQPDFRPLPGSPALVGAAAPPADGFFDTSATYVGAFDESDDWTAGWAAYPEN